MPIVGKAKEVLSSMKNTYKDPEKAERVFYATANKQGRKAENWKKKASAVLSLVLARRHDRA